MKPLDSIALDMLYKHINDSLRASGLHNDQIRIKARVKLPDENRIVDLKIIGTTLTKEKITPEEQAKMSGMYLPTERATIYIDCETMKDVEIASVDKGS